MSEEREREEDRPDPESPREGTRPPGEADPEGAGTGPEGEGFAVDMDAITEADVIELLEKAREGEVLLDKLQRLRAEHENYRKRMAREIEVQRRWAVRDFALDILPVVDNLERALASSGGEPGAGAAEAIRDGLKMVLDMFRGILKANGIVPIEAAEQRFDPAFHEAAGQVDAPGVEPGAVAAELQKGYVLKDLVIRPSRVLVAKGPRDREQEEREAE